MTPLNAIRAYDTGMPSGTMHRLFLFAEWTGTTPPARILEGEGADRTFAPELLAYAAENGLSLDWLLLNDERGLVMAQHNQVRGRA